MPPKRSLQRGSSAGVVMGQVYRRAAHAFVRDPCRDSARQRTDSGHACWSGARGGVWRPRRASGEVDAGAAMVRCIVQEAAMSNPSPVTPARGGNASRYLFVFLLGLVLGVVGVVMGMRAWDARRDHFHE